MTWAEKAMAPHSSTLAWKIPWMEEPGRLQFMESLRVGHDWATSLSLFTFTHWRRKWQPTPVFLPGESQGWGRLPHPWRIPGMGEPGGLPSMGSHRVGHYWSDLAVAAWPESGHFGPLTSKVHLLDAVTCPVIPTSFNWFELKLAWVDSKFLNENLGKHCFSYMLLRRYASVSKKTVKASLFGKGRL